MKSQSVIPLQILLFLLIVINNTNGQSQEQIDFAGGSCSRSDNISTNGTYHSNMLTLLNNFHSISISNKFFTSSAGEGVDRVNGFYFCRPDLPLTTCHGCVNATIDLLNSFCFDKKEAIIWHEECTLRYTNISLAAANATDPWRHLYSELNVSQPLLFPSLLNQTMQKLISKVVLPTNDQLFFEVRSDNFTLFEGIFGMVWCNPSIKAKECEDCLTTALERIPTCCGGLSVYTMIFMPNCQLRYDTAPFIISPPSSLLSPSSSPPTLAPVP